MMDKPEGRRRNGECERPAGSGWRLRAGTGHLEVHRGEWKRLFVKGINLGLGLPGSFPENMQ